IPRPTTRLLALLELLQARDWVSGAELARRLEINGRSVRRYITMLEEIGIPIETARGRAGGYRLRPGYKLPPLLFTDEEAVVLALALRGLPHLGLRFDPAALLGLEAKLARVLPVALGERVRALETGIAFDRAATLADTAGALVATLGEAAGRAQQVRLGYRAESGSETARVVDPYGVVQWSFAWYLVGYCHLREGLRLFRVDRITAAEPLEAIFSPPMSFDAHAYVVAQMATYPARWTVAIRLGLPLAVARRRIPPAYGLLTATDDGTIFRGSFDDLERIARWLPTLGCPLVVHEPPELRIELGRLAAEIAAMAGARDLAGSERAVARGDDTHGRE
ncbi:MAG TPA: YafY family protein, partial [Thermomicrobiales bacterium]